MLQPILSVMISAALFVTVGCASRDGCGNHPDDTLAYQVSPDDYRTITEHRRSLKLGTNTTPPHSLNVLVLSGGGSNGAWGAGFLSGWSKNGARPQFDVVTGISTGALMATAALIRDDASLKAAYTTTTNDQVAKERWLITIPFSNSVRETHGRLDKLIEKYVPNPAIDQVATAAADHRFVFVASVNLDSGKLVIWNLSKMAVEHKYSLYREAIYASASAPALFPPVKVGGHLHVDGGTRQSLFFYKYLVPGAIRAQQGQSLRTAMKASTTAPATPPDELYIIVNGELGMSSACPANNLFGIIPRAIDCLLAANSIGSLYEAVASSKGFTLNLSRIPDGKSIADAFDFVPSEMTSLYDAGEADGEANHWEHDLPIPQQ